MAAASSIRSTLQNVTDDQKRWLVFGIALNKVFITKIRPFVEQEIQKEYCNLQTSHSIHTQSTAGHLQRWPTFLKYENINGNDAYPRLRSGRYNYSLFDCQVTSHVDFAKLYVENRMAKFNAFDEHCDASAVLILLGKVPVFSGAVQSAAGDVRQARNAWAHCVFSDWDQLKFQQCFAQMEQLVKDLGLPSADERDLLKELKDWEMKGEILCMNATIDPNLVKMVQHDVNALKNDVDKLTFEEKVNRENLKKALQDAVIDLEELHKRVTMVEQEQEIIKREQEVIKEDQSSLCENVKCTQGQISELKSEQDDVQQRVHDLGENLDTRLTIVEQEQHVVKQEQQLMKKEHEAIKNEQEVVRQEQQVMRKEQKVIKQEHEVVKQEQGILKHEHEVIKQDHISLCDKVSTTIDQISALQSEQEDVQQRVTYLEDQQNTIKPQINYEIANCEADITFFAQRHHEDTRQWLLDDFDKWFNDPGDSRAYVLLGDPGVGKSVIAGVLAQRSKKAGSLGAAYFCRHNDGSRNDPRYLLGTIACQLCKSNSLYNSIVGGESGVRTLLGNSNLGVQELFTKLLHEPLGRSTRCQQRKLVIIDALDETHYESREDFLDLIMHRFPLLPKWLVFFITSRPEETVQLRLNKYNPCIKICAGSSKDRSFYQQHERDIKLFLEKSVDFSHLEVPYSLEDITKRCNGLFLYAFYIARVLENPMHSGKIDQRSDLFPGDIDNFFLQNFTRVVNKIGANLYKKLFGCAIVAPSPLPVSFIPFILRRENSDLDEQEVIDAVSQFVVLRTSDQTFTFLHNLIPTWLTDKKKASRKLFIDRIEAGEYFRDIIAEFFSFAVVDQQWEKPQSVETDLFDYCFRVGVRFLCANGKKGILKTIFSCLTSYQFIWKRIQNIGIEIYSVIFDLKLAARSQGLSNAEKEILQEIGLALESNVHILQECPHLLHSCLRNASKVVQTNVSIPDGLSTSWMEWKGFLNPDGEILRDMSCFALSPDKKLLVGGKEQNIWLFDACSLGKVQGPFQVIDTGDKINHLQFSPDGKYLFFGKLDRLFSLEGRCLKTFSQFARKETRYYKWGCFTSDGTYIVVKGEHPLKQTHNLSCLVNIFCRWATQELRQVKSSKITLSYRTNTGSVFLSGKINDFPLSRLFNNQSRHFRYSGYTIESLLDLLSLLKNKKPPDWYWFLENHLSSHHELIRACDDTGGGQPVANPLCLNCHEFYHNHRKTTLAVVRQRVIDLYPEIFEYQVWNVRTGKSALEEAFYSGVPLSPFLYLCHMMTVLEDLDGKLFLDIDKALSLHNLAFMIVVYFLLKNVNQWSSSFVSGSFLRSSFVRSEFHTCPVLRQSRFSLDGKWVVSKQGSSVDISVNLPAKISPLEKGFYSVKNVKDFVFTEDSSGFLYVTEENSLHLLCLQTGIIRSSVSGLKPLFYVPEKQLGYIFCVQDEERHSFEEYFRNTLSSEILCQPGKTSFESILVPASSVLSVFTDTVLPSWKITDDDDAPSAEGFQVRKCVFSQSGKLIVTHQGTKILLFDFGKLVCSVCDERYDENDVSCLTFSPDSSLLLYSIQNRRGARTDDQDFYVWDVQNRVLSSSFDSPSGLLFIDCCSFSSDNTKLIMCGECSFEIWEYASRPSRLLTKVETNVLGLYTEVDRFTHCTVSPEGDLLACCFVDKILFYELNKPTNQSVLQLPRAHLGKIEFCQFLKGNHHLISYGVDGIVFLWDLSKWEATAYAKVGQGRESIVSMGMLPEEDEVVCLTSLGRTCMIKLRGIVHEIPSKFPTTEAMERQKMVVASRRQQGEETSSTFKRAASPLDEAKAMDWTEFVEEMNIMADENLESEEDFYEGESDE